MLINNDYITIIYTWITHSDYIFFLGNQPPIYNYKTFDTAILVIMLMHTRTSSSSKPTPFSLHCCQGLRKYEDSLTLNLLINKSNACRSHKTIQTRNFFNP